MINGRIVGEYSIHSDYYPDSCKGDHSDGVWRTVECGGLAGEGRDIVECSKCGMQRNVPCTFDEEYA